MKLLVVDDDASLVSSLRRGLEAEGFVVEVAVDGPEGLWQARETRFDAIVLDVLLPGLNGYGVCAALRAEGDTTPILMLTAMDDDLDEAEGLDTGADDYLTKPFAFAVLVARIHALLRRAALGAPPPVQVGDIRLDVRTRTATCAGEPVPLTSKEFHLLEFLVRRAGTVVSKRQILAGVWDGDFDGDPNIVEVYVARLRRKLDGPRRQTIETVRGAGYRLLAP